jgi:hypothetical protein
VNALHKGDRVRVVADTEGGYHYLPIGTSAVVDDEPREGDTTVQVRTTEAITSTSGNAHNAGLVQIVPMADLTKTHEPETLGSFLHEAQIPGVPCPDHHPEEG